MIRGFGCCCCFSCFNEDYCMRFDNNDQQNYNISSFRMRFCSVWNFIDTNRGPRNDIQIILWEAKATAHIFCMYVEGDKAEKHFSRKMSTNDNPVQLVTRWKELRNHRHSFNPYDWMLKTNYEKYCSFFNRCFY